MWVQPSVLFLKDPTLPVVPMSSSGDCVTSDNNALFINDFAIVLIKMWRSSRVAWAAGIAALAAVLLCTAPTSAAEPGRQLLAYGTEFPPNCSCIRSPRAAPFLLDATSRSPAVGAQKYCFSVDTTASCQADKFEKCCDDKIISKIEFNIGKGHVRETLLLADLSDEILP
jgi:hypothetical protein